MILYIIFTYLYSQQFDLNKCLEIASKENPQIKIAEQKVIYLSRSGKSSGKFGGMSGQKETSATGFIWGMLVIIPVVYSLFEERNAEATRN